MSNLSVPTTPVSESKAVNGVRVIRAVFASALVWAILAYFVSGTYLLAAVLIGVVVATAVIRLFPRPSLILALLLFLPAVLLTAVAILLGDYLFYVFVLLAEGNTLSQAATLVAANFAELAAVESTTSLIYAFIGTLIGHVYGLWRDASSEAVAEE